MKQFFYTNTMMELTEHRLLRFASESTSATPGSDAESVPESAPEASPPLAREAIITKAVNWFARDNGQTARTVNGVVDAFVTGRTAWNKLRGPSPVQEARNAAPAAATAPALPDIMQQMDPRTKAAYLTGTLVHQSPALRSELQQLIHSMMPAQSYEVLRRQNPDAFGRLVAMDRTIQDHLVRSGMTSVEIQSARMQIGTAQGTIAFSMQALRFGDQMAPQSKGVEAGIALSETREANNDMRLLIALVLLLAVAIAALEAVRAEEEDADTEEDDVPPDAETSDADSLTVEDIVERKTPPDEVRAAHAQRRTELRKARGALKQSATTLAEYDKQGKRISEESAESKTELKSLQRKDNKTEADKAEIAELQKNIENLKREATDLAAQREAAVEERRELRSRVTVLRREVAALKQVMLLDTLVRTMQQQIDRLTQEAHRELGSFSVSRNGITLGETEGEMHSILKAKPGATVPFDRALPLLRAAVLQRKVDAKQEESSSFFYQLGTSIADASQALVDAVSGSD